MDKQNQNHIGLERRRKQKQKQNGDEYGTEELNLTTSIGPRRQKQYDMNTMDKIDLGDGGTGTTTGQPTKYLHSNDEEEEDSLGLFDDSGSTDLELQPTQKNQYSSVNVVEDAPMNSTGMYEEDDDMPITAVVDDYDAGLR